VCCVIENAGQLINGPNESTNAWTDLDIAPWPKDPPDVAHNNLWWVPLIATAVIASQAIVIAFMR
jgi:hypothetical protein